MDQEKLKHSDSLEVQFINVSNDINVQQVWQAKSMLNVPSQWVEMACWTENEPIVSG